jgi:hypothetical protein
MYQPGRGGLRIEGIPVGGYEFRQWIGGFLFGQGGGHSFPEAGRWLLAIEVRAVVADKVIQLIGGHGIILFW